MDPIVRRYELELIDSSSASAPPSSPDAWVCRPDEQSRQRDPHLPLDRIASMRFVIFEPNAAEPMPVRPAELSYEPLTL
jgi:hypothetical protein